jgi:hypothetical protein
MVQVPLNLGFPANVFVPGNSFHSSPVFFGQGWSLPEWSHLRESSGPYPQILNKAEGTNTRAYLWTKKKVL